MAQLPRCLLPILALILMALPAVSAQEITASAKAEAELQESIRLYAVYTTHLVIDGRYSGQAEQGQFHALVVWIHRDGRWQQLASQMTADPSGSLGRICVS